MPTISQEGYDYEDDLAVESAAYLDRVLPDDAEWWHTPNQGHGIGRTPSAVRDSMRMAMKLKSMGMKPGMPDIMILWQGRLYTTDTKSRTGRLSKDQEDRIGRLIRAGAHVQPTYRTIDELESHLIGWGIPLKFRYSELKAKPIMKPSEARAMTAIASASATIKQRRTARAGRSNYALAKGSVRGG